VFALVYQRVDVMFSESGAARSAHVAIALWVERRWSGS
jgi:hypothetical protein